jgi:hypothetical protein
MLQFAAIRNKNRRIKPRISGVQMSECVEKHATTQPHHATETQKSQIRCFARTDFQEMYPVRDR